ncbi:MAG: acyl carrier protein [Muricoprocola sp.]
MFEKLKEVITNYVEVAPENIHPETRFMEDLGFTSFDFMSMLGELEEELDVEISEQEVSGIRTVGEAAAYLSKISCEDAQ